MAELHLYSEDFFEYIERGAIASAKEFTKLLVPLLRPTSVLDVGCGRGAWVREWKKAGVETAKGVDGPYVRTESLHIPRDDFSPVDLATPFRLGERFDLVTSLEVAEHLDPSCSTDFVSTLAAHADMVVFSASTPGQGGENHINERPLVFWQRLFASLGYDAYDVIRLALRGNKAVEPWYRFNSILYVEREAAGALPAQIQRTLIEPEGIAEIGDLGWRLRKAILRPLPVAAVTALSKLNYHRLNSAHRRRAAKVAQ
ncbi:bifunctional 2-polyprenyl-6-hydroxyphenol methylase/3-demethylubiquinol 3-O-methyltransferase UbiG [Bradyrhizobium liaoningense]|uniref:class I SAM-dependent methyltransferase n=1 Tax=Bradyrhizobium liaoningense TaxID=43992 RepID=UPI001BA45947|nr:methyltransferase domain-containing protein [Bradyrhizobium liaoningense]MBR0940212.1 methyltransferase domain-containing protein [Bradyrhizobium liaoningense]